MGVTITGHCARCQKGLTMNKEGDYQVRWDFWTDKSDEGNMRGSSANVLCIDCCVTLQEGFMRGHMTPSVDRKEELDNFFNKI